MISTDYVRPAAIKPKVIEDSCPRFGLHNMRYGLATWLVDQGNSPEIVQRMLRWSSTRMLQRYVHPAKKTRRAQGEFLKRMNGKRARRRVQEKRSPKRETRMKSGAGDGI